MWDHVRGEPALVLAVLAILVTGVLVALGAVDFNGGEWVAFLGAVLGVAGVTRARVTPV